MTPVRNRLVLTDINETVLRFADAFQAWAHGQGYFTPHRLRDLFDIRRTFEVSEATAQHWVSGFARSPEYGAIPPEPCAARVLPMMHHLGWHFVAISAALDDPAVVEMRAQNLAAAFGFRFSAVHCVGYHASKAPILARYPAAVWVEDHPEHARAGAALGHRSFLMDRRYNRDAPPHAGVTRVADWDAIWALLKPQD